MGFDAISVGNLLSSSGLDTPYQYNAWYQNSNYIALTSADTWDREQTNLNNLADGIGASSISNLGVIGTIFNVKSFNAIQEAVTAHNNELGKILENKINSYKSHVNAEDVYFEGNKLVVDLKVATTFSSFIITLDADKVGLVELKGTPKILQCPSSQDILSGKYSNPTLRVKNIGDNGGSFSKCAGRDPPTARW